MAAAIAACLLAVTEHGAEVEGRVLDRGGELHLGRKVFGLILPRVELFLLFAGIRVGGCGRRAWAAWGVGRGGVGVGVVGGEGVSGAAA